MTFVLIAAFAGTLMTTTYDTREACLKRASELFEQKIDAKCIEWSAQGAINVFPYGEITPRAPLAADDPRVREAAPCLLLGGGKDCFQQPQ